MLTFLDIATDPVEELISSDAGVFALIGFLILVAVVAVVVIVRIVRKKHKNPAAGQETGAAATNQPGDTEEAR